MLSVRLLGVFGCSVVVVVYVVIDDLDGIMCVDDDVVIMCVVCVVGCVVMEIVLIW